MYIDLLEEEFCDLLEQNIETNRFSLQSPFHVRLLFAKCNRLSDHKSQINLSFNLLYNRTRGAKPQLARI